MAISADTGAIPSSGIVAVQEYDSSSTPRARLVSTELATPLGSAGGGRGWVFWLGGLVASCATPAAVGRVGSPVLREDGPVVVAPAVDATPFQYATTDTYSRLACVVSCTITLPVLPMHTAFYQVKFYNAGGSLVATGETGVASEGTAVPLP